MAEPENQTFRLLRDVREAIRTVDAKVDGVDGKLEARFRPLKGRMDNIWQLPRRIWIHSAPGALKPGG